MYDKVDVHYWLWPSFNNCLLRQTSRKAILGDLSLRLPLPTILTPVVLKFLQLPPFTVITSIVQVSDMAPDLHQFFSFMTIVLRW